MRVDELGSLSAPALRPLWEAVHARLSSGRAVSRVRVGPLDDEQRHALADLLGKDRLPGTHTTVSLRVLEQIVMQSVGLDVRSVVAELVGPVEDRAGARTAAASRRSELWNWLARHEVVAAQPALRSWVDAVRRSGVDGSVERTRDRLDGALRVLARLPASGTPLPVLADEVLHDPHALDDGTRCSTLVLRALAAIYELDQPRNAEQRRALWERAGVADDALSSVVLAAGLRPDADDVAAAVLRSCVDAGHAAALTLQHLREARWENGLPRNVWVFENPSVLALALDRFGRSCPPVVCTSGWPNSAASALLRMLGQRGCELLYHGDLDGEGVRIAAHTAALPGVRPWRMSSEDYLAAVESTPTGPPVGRVSDAPWDEDLAAHMRTRGIAVSEERVAAGLLDEMRHRHGT